MADSEVGGEHSQNETFSLGEAKPIALEEEDDEEEVNKNQSYNFPPAHKFKVLNKPSMSLKI